jgi:ArsR family transcriptional regulator
MVSVLVSGEFRVADIALSIGMTQTATSQQMATLRDAKLVEARKDGHKIYYTLSSDFVMAVMNLPRDLSISRE